MPSEQLLPCPFCGGRAAWGEGEQKLTYGNEQVYCSNCYAITPPYATKREAALPWNSRCETKVEIAEGSSIALEEIKRDIEALASVPAVPVGEDKALRDLEAWLGFRLKDCIKHRAGTPPTYTDGYSYVEIPEWEARQKLAAIQEFTATPAPKPAGKCVKCGHPEDAKRSERGY